MSPVALERTIFDTDHEAFRSTVRAFAEREVVPQLRERSEQGHVAREVHRRAGEPGLPGISAEEKYNGGGIDDFRFNAVLTEELARAGATAVAMNLSGFNDLVASYLTFLATDEQKQRWLAPMCSGESTGAIAMTGPGAGSDLAGIATTAVPGGDDLVLNGAETFISNGMLADTSIVVARIARPPGGAG